MVTANLDGRFKFSHKPGHICGKYCPDFLSDASSQGMFYVRFQGVLECLGPLTQTQVGDSQNGVPIYPPSNTKKCLDHYDSEALNPKPLDNGLPAGLKSLSFRCPMYPEGFELGPIGYA